MNHVDETRLERDLPYRIGYLTEFMGFTSDDVKSIHNSASLLAPLVPALVDAVYDKLHSYDATWRHFVPRQFGFTGSTADSPEALAMDHEVIQFRKQHLARYFTALVTRPYDEKMLSYLDMVGKIHTPAAGNAQIDVPLVQMNALLGFVADALVATITGLNLPRETEIQTLRAFTKLLWVQNDLINRHYTTDSGYHAVGGDQRQQELQPA
jgi:hypothetical protein